MDENCETCKYLDSSIEKEPCCSCIDFYVDGYPQWQPKEEKPLKGNMIHHKPHVLGNNKRKPITYTREEFFDKFLDINLKELIDNDWEKWCKKNPKYSEEQKNFYWSGIAHGVFLVIEKIKNQKEDGKEL